MSILRGRSLNDTSIRVIFCDPDLAHVERNREVVAQVAEIAGGGHSVETLQYSTGAELLAVFEPNRRHEHPTIIILETELADFKGLELARIIRELCSDCQIIIFSKTDKHALKAYEVGLSAYLLKKKASRKKFAKALKCAMKQAVADTRRYVTFICAGYHETVLLSDICYFEINKKIVTVYHEDTSFDFYSSLNHLEHALDNRGFIRISRKHIVSLSKIKRHSKEQLVMECGVTLPIGQNYQYEVAAHMHAISMF